MEIKRNLLCCQKARILGSDYLYWSRYFSLDVPGKRWLQAVDGDKMHKHGWMFVVGRNACTSKYLLPTPRPGCPKSPRSRTDLGSSAFLFLRFPVSSGFWISALDHLLWSPIFFFFPHLFIFTIIPPLCPTLRNTEVPSFSQNKHYVNPSECSGLLIKVGVSEIS